MKAVFLTGISKSTINPLTESIPKSMLPIMNKPLLEHSIAALRHWGIDEVFIGTSGQSKAIRQHFGNGSGFGLKIKYVSQEPSLGIAGTLKKMAGLFKDTFLIVNENTLCNMDLSALMKAHRTQSAGLTVAVIQSPTAGAAECIETDENGCVVLPSADGGKATSKPGLISAGIYMAEPAVLSGMADNLPLTHFHELFPALIAGGVKIATCDGCSYWMDMSKPQDYLKAHEDIFSGDYQVSGVRFLGQSVIKDGNSVIDSTAVITGPVFIGDNVTIGAYATIGPNAVIGDNVRVHMGGKVVNSVLWNNVDVGICAKLEGSVAASEYKVKRKTEHIDTALTQNIIIRWRKASACPVERLGT